MSKLLVFDDALGGHHPDFLAGFCRAANGAGHELLVAAPELCNPAIDDWCVRHLSVEPFSVREPVKGARVVTKVLDEAMEHGIDLFVDLFMDKNIWATSYALSRRKIRSAHVLHRTTQYEFEGRTAVGAVRTRFLRSQLGRMTRSSRRVVVHTTEAFDSLAGAADTQSIVLAGLPVCTLDQVDARVAAPSSRSRSVILFVGAAKQEKGLIQLFQAVSTIGRDVELVVAGAQPSGLRELVATEFPEVRVVWHDRFLDRQELTELFRASDLVALPYQDTYVGSAASGVFWEAMSYGRPTLVTSALQSQVPEGYGGVIVAGPQPESICKALAAALDNLDLLQGEAVNRGTEIIRADHTFESYVQQVLEGV